MSLLRIKTIGQGWHAKKTLAWYRQLESRKYGYFTEMSSLFAPHLPLGLHFLWSLTRKLTLLRSYKNVQVG